MILIFSIFLIMLSAAYCSEEYNISVTSDSPIAEGTSVNFNVTFLINGRQAPPNDYQFRWIFDSEKSIKTHDPVVSFSINAENLTHGRYQVDIAVDEFYIFLYLQKARTQISFDVTNHFNGQMQLTQNPNNTIRENGYVSSWTPTLHSILISEKDNKLLSKAAYFRVYWFIDCIYVGLTDELNFTNWYQKENEKYQVEALLEISYEPLPPVTSTTTTTEEPPTTATTTTELPKTSTTTTATKEPAASGRRKRHQEGESPDFEWNEKALIETGSIKPLSIAKEKMSEMDLATQIPMSVRIKMAEDFEVPYFGVCNNNSKIISDPKRIYGYYQRKIIVENPIANVTVGNNVWLKHGDMCKLNIKFGGTAPFHYCPKIVNSNPNSTTAVWLSYSEEECSDWRITEMKEIEFQHFFPKTSNTYSLILLIKNEVSLKRTTIGIQFYDVQPHSQLSVILVPVVFSLMAVVLIVFGIAYYIQNRNRFLVEVADFNFGESQSVESLEYKSFVQRLLDDFSDLFIRNQYSEESDIPGPSGGQSPSQESSIRYGAMP